MKRVLLTFMVIVAGLAMAAPDASAQSGNRNGRTDKGQSNMDAWQKDMAEFRARSNERRHIQELTDSIASVQAFAAVKNQDFVLEAQTVQFRNGSTVFVNSMTNFISVKGNRAVVQISPSDFAAGPNGVGGVTRPNFSSVKILIIYNIMPTDSLIRNVITENLCSANSIIIPVTASKIAPETCTFFLLISTIDSTKSIPHILIIFTNIIHISFCSLLFPFIILSFIHTSYMVEHRP